MPRVNDLTTGGSLAASDELVVLQGGVVIKAPISLLPSSGAGVTDGDKGDITVSGAGATWAIDNDAVTYAKIQNVSAADRILGRVTAGAGDVEELTGAQVRTIAGAAATSHTHALADITDEGALAALNTVGTAQIDNDAVTNAKLADVATQTFKGRTTAGTGDPEDLTVAQAKTLLDLTGINSGDQTIALTGDVTGSGTGSFAATIANDAVTYAKLQNVSASRLLGRATASIGDAEEITLGTNLSFSGTTLNASGGGGAAWTGITAGSGSSTTDNGDSDIIYRVAQTTASRISWRFTESTASAAGGSPALLQVDTIAGSAARPLLVKSQGTDVFYVSENTTQIRAASGTALLPVYSFAANNAYGLALLGTGVSVVNNAVLNTQWGVGVVKFSKGTADAVGYGIEGYKSRGSVASPTVITSGDDLLKISASGYVGATNTYQEACNITFDSTGTISDSATGIGGIIRFSVATVGGEPTEVFNVTGTQLRAVSGALGTPTYSFAAAAGAGMWWDSSNLAVAISVSGSTKVRMDSNAVYAQNGNAAVPAFSFISDASSGLFRAATGIPAIAAGSTEIVRWQKATTGGGWAIMDEADSDPTTTELDANDSLAIYNKNNKLVFAYNNAGTITYVSLPLDGSSTTWTHSTTAP